MSRLAASMACAGALIGTALAGTPADRPASSGRHIVLPFIENDFPTALARAREARLPLFVEVWAPW